MKVLRGLCSIITGIILLPIIVLTVIMIGTYLVYVDIKWYIIYKENVGKTITIWTIKSMYELVLLGIRSSILWVKYGKEYFKHIEEL